VQQNRPGYIRVRASSTEEARRIIGAPPDAPCEYVETVRGQSSWDIPEVALPPLKK
jgi:hypothetical protein